MGSRKTNERLWYATLPDDARERLFSTMRALGEREASHRSEAQRLSAPSGTLAVGPGAFEALIPALAIGGFLTALRRGKSPDEAAEFAKVELAEAVRTHNSQRPNDVWWRRWEGAGASMIPHLVWTVTQAVNGKRSSQ